MKLFVGLGNRLRGDDWIGGWAIKKLKKEIDSAEFLLVDQSPEMWALKIKSLKPEEVIFIDSIMMGCNPGKVKLLKLEELSESLPTTHSSSLHLLADYLKNEIPVKIIGIEPKRLELGSTISTRVKKAYPAIKKMVKKIINQ